MKFTASIVFIGTLLISQLAIACPSSYDAKKKATLEDKTISELTKKELLKYWEENDKLYKTWKDGKKMLRDGLSVDANKAMHKHFKRNKKAVTKVN